MEFNVWLLYLITEFVLSITPGPAVILVSGQGLKYGAEAGYFGAFGISTSNLIYFLLSALGLGAVILAAGDLFFWIRIAGAMYLMGTGIMMIRDSFHKKEIALVEIKKSPGHNKSYLQGFITQIANPKAIIFFVALLPQFIDPARSIMVQFTILAFTTIIMETIILMLYAWLASQGRKLTGPGTRIRNWQDKLAGSVLIGLGINLLFLKMKQN